MPETENNELIRLSDRKIEGNPTISEASRVFNDDMKNVMSFIQDEIAKVYPKPVLSIEYFVLAILNIRDCSAFKLLGPNLSSYNTTQIATAYESTIAERALSIMKPGRELKLDDSFVKYINDAMNFAGPNKNIGSDHMLLALLNDDDPKNLVRSVFNKVGITFNLIMDKMSDGFDPDNTIIIPGDIEKFNMPNGQIIPFEGGYKIMLPVNKNGEIDGNRYMQTLGQMFQSQGQKQKNDNAISKYCINITEQAEQGKIDRIIGRENELDEIVRILGRRRKNNVIIVGGEGVGKTSIAENLAYKILEGNVPDFLKGKTVISLDMTSLIAGTTLRGMFEERTKAIIDEMKNSGKYILLIDNIGSVLGHKNSNDYDISSMLSLALERGDLQVVGTSDFKNFRSTFDKDPSLSRRFQRIIVEAPSVADSIDILNGVKGYYEGFHGVQYSDEAVNACVMLSERYITERNLPDSAIDILDEAGSMVGHNVPEDARVGQLKSEISAINEEIKKYKEVENYEEADKAEEHPKGRKMALSRVTREIARRRANNPPIVPVDTILQLVSKKTGIPVTNLSSDDKKKLVTMSDRLKEEVIGQDEAIDIITRSLKRNRLGLHGGGTMFSALMVGRTGVGKTLIAKKLAKEMFGSEDNLVRFDMSEYPDKSAVNKLIGSNPGYIGYEEGGQLTEAIKNHKHCVLLIDEIEKADPEIYNIFLQVLDEGFLTDNSGMKVDFKNTIVIFTSNVGTKAASDFSRGIGFNDDEEANSKKILEKQLKNKFPPEFINRLDNVIYFNNLSDDKLSKIIEIEIGKMVKNVNEIGYDVSYDEGTVSYILSCIKAEKDYGARPILRAIRTEIEDKLTDKLLEGDYDKGYTFNVTFDEVENAVSIS